MKMLKRLICALLAVLMLCGLCSCALFKNEVVEITEKEAEPYLAMTEAFLDALFAEDYVAAYAMLGENLVNTKTRRELQDEWEQMRLTYGNPVGVERYEPYRINGEGTILAQVAMTHGACSVQLTYDKNNALVGLWFGMADEPGSYTVAIPENVQEIDLALNAQGEYPLRAVLTLPKDAVNVPCVVLVHDAGAYDLNSALGGCTPFADIAHGLAQQGIASLRYDKRTYSYGYDMEEKEVQAMTVQQEVIEDALSAVTAAAEAENVDAQRIYVAGHGLGGMLAPRIAVQSKGAVAGIVSMNGTARGYLDVVYDQNLATTSDAERKNAVKKEYKKVEKLDEMKDSATLFGLPVPYLKDLYANPVEEQLAQLNIPVLVMHGKNDFQYTLSDFKSWQTALDGYAGASELVLLDNLNHLFVNNESLKRRATAAEYLSEQKVAQEFVDCLAEWVKEN